MTAVDLTVLAREFRAALAAWEPGVHSGDDCATIVEELARVENASAAARARGALRVVECHSHRDRGFADAHDWLASVAGTTSRDAKVALDTARTIDSCPDTADAWNAGTVSTAQAAEIDRTQREVPGAEGELLELAEGGSLGAVRERGRARRLEALDQEDLHRRQHAAREFRHWRDERGMVCGSFALTPSVGVAFVNRLERATDRRWRAARRERTASGGAAEVRAALAADAFVEMMASPEPSAKSGTRRGASAELVIVQDSRVARRGHAHPGELCHIVGGGPIAPSEIEALGADLFVKAVLHDGEQVTHVAHFGRNLTAAQRTARGIGPPPEFDGRRCSEPGCERRLGLETDHVVPFAEGGATSGENLRDRCVPHHWQKTERDRARVRGGGRPPP